MNRLLLGYSPDFDLFDEAAPAPNPGGDETSVLHDDHTEEATELLEVARGPALPALLARLLRSAAGAAGGSVDAAVETELVGLLQRAARVALPAMSTASPGGSVQAGRFFGIELEGLSPEDREFETARRFVHLVESSARNAALASPRLPPAVAAWLATVRAAKRIAPGWPAAMRPPQGASAVKHHRSERIAAGRSRPFSLQGAHHA